MCGDIHIDYVKCASELAARKAQVRILRKIARNLYREAIKIAPYRRTIGMRDAIALYVKEMM